MTDNHKELLIIIIVLILAFVGLTFIGGCSHVHEPGSCGWVNYGEGRIAQECTEEELIWWWEK